MDERVPQKQCVLQ